MRIDLKQATIQEGYGYLSGLVTPRPIAFASTIDEGGKVNLSPFSFFNAFSSNPPMVIFSPVRKGRDNTQKHTWENVSEVPEVVINLVDYAMVQQMSLSSADYEKGVNEFIKSGLTEVPSELVKPPRVKEAPASLECKVQQLLPLGDQGGAGQLVICEVLLIHLNDNILDENKKVDPHKFDAVGRLGGNWYVRVFGESIFEVPRPAGGNALGIDSLPTAIVNSRILTGNDLGMLGNVKSLPNADEIEEFSREPEISSILEYFADDPNNREIELHKQAKNYLQQSQIEKAWLTLLQQ